MDRYTLHVRLTHACNADCSYCSSRLADPGRHMSLDDFTKSCSFIVRELLPVFGHEKRNGHLSIQYVGGEILTVPARTLEAQVLAAREIFSSAFVSIRDGVQSNLIGSSARVRRLHDLFEGRLGTSIDNFTDERTVNGSPAEYRAIARKRIDEIEALTGHHPSGVLVVDAASAPNVADEVRKAIARNYGLTLRPVFSGGSRIAPAEMDVLQSTYLEAACLWLEHPDVPIEPFTRLFTSRLARATGNVALLSRLAGCPFQSDCARLSLDLEPDGTLYLCQDMADSQQFPIGNALNETLDTETWSRLDARRLHLSSECRVCPWRRECQGGCMSEAIHHTGSPYGRTELCPVWKSLFSLFDRFIADKGAEACARHLAPGVQSA